MKYLAICFPGTESQLQEHLVNGVKKRQRSDLALINHLFEYQSMQNKHILTHWSHYTDRENCFETCFEISNMKFPMGYL